MRDGKFFGHTDVPLTRQGKLQVKAALKRMASEKLAAVYCSDMQRSFIMADAIGRRNSPRHKPVSLAALRELNLGIWEGMSYKQIMERYPAELQARYQDLAGFRIPEGESLQDLAERALPAFQEMAANHQGQRVCVVAHAGVNRVILAKLMGAPLDRIFRLEQDYACLNVIDVYEDGTPVIKRFNEPLATQ